VIEGGLSSKSPGALIGLGATPFRSCRLWTRAARLDAAEGIHEVALRLTIPAAMLMRADDEVD
jgi:hypothetical protein